MFDHWLLQDERNRAPQPGPGGVALAALVIGSRQPEGAVESGGAVGRRPCVPQLVVLMGICRSYSVPLSVHEEGTRLRSGF